MLTALDMSLICIVLVGGILIGILFQWRRVSLITAPGGCMLLGVGSGFLYCLMSSSSLSLARSSAVHDIIYFGLLPPIIFEAGFTMRRRNFFANFGTIMLYAVCGTCITIVVTGFLLSWLSDSKLLETQLSLSQAIAILGSHRRCNQRSKINAIA